MTFSASSYDIIRDGAQRSAMTIVPMLMNLLTPQSVVDVGCGEGWWTRAFAQLGCTVLGVDGHDGQDIDFPYRAVDLQRAPHLDLGRADLALCLEVAEHLPATRGDWLIDVLTTTADAVVFSAAIPGQGGQGHVNEQPPAYWADSFIARGFAVTGALRWRLWDLAPQQVENWYAQNLLLAMRDPGHLAPLFMGPEAVPLHVVHPVLFEARR